MSRRIVLSAAAGAVVLGGAGVFAAAFAFAGEQAPALAHSTVHYTAPAGSRDGSVTFTTDVEADSGVRSVKVLPWPAKSSLGKKELTVKEMAAPEVESATCKPAGGKSVRCRYTARITGAEAASLHGSWYVAVLATAQDGTTTLDTEAAAFTAE